MSGLKPVIEMRSFRPGDAAAFRELNEDWIRKNFVLEPQDVKSLADPEGYILRKGGQIYLVEMDGDVVGCCALLVVRPGVFEVGKMTVAERCRGLGIGRRMLEYVIEQGRALGAVSLYLETNTGLKDAVHLYESAGFTHLPPERVVPSPYARANVYMELMLAS